jgi:prophage regulatory protein
MTIKNDDKTRGAHAAPSATRLLSFNELRDRGISYSRVQLWRMVRAGRFPAPVKLGPSRSAWVETEVDSWIEARMAERGGVGGEVGGR